MKANLECCEGQADGHAFLRFVNNKGAVQP